MLYLLFIILVWKWVTKIPEWPLMPLKLRSFIHKSLFLRYLSMGPIKASLPSQHSSLLGRSQVTKKKKPHKWDPRLGFSNDIWQIQTLLLIRLKYNSQAKKALHHFGQVSFEITTVSFSAYLQLLYLMLYHI